MAGESLPKGRLLADQQISEAVDKRPTSTKALRHTQNPESTSSAIQLPGSRIRRSPVRSPHGDLSGGEAIKILLYRTAMDFSITRQKWIPRSYVFARQSKGDSAACIEAWYRLLGKVFLRQAATSLEDFVNAPLDHTSTVKAFSTRSTGRYNVSRSTGSRPASPANQPRSSSPRRRFCETWSPPAS